MENSKITIVGGGPVGASLACALAYFQIPCRLVEKTRRDFFLSDSTSDCRAIALSPTSKTFLNHIGVWDFIKSGVCPIHSVETVHGSTDTTITFEEKEKDGPLGYIVAMSLLRQGIARSTRNFPDFIEWVEGSLDFLDRSGSSFHVHLKEGITFQAPILIGADGKNSLVRRLAEFETISHLYDKEAIVCTYAHTNDHKNIAWEIFMEEGPFAILPMTQNRSSIVWSVQKDIAKSLREAEDHTFDHIMLEKLGPYLQNPKRISQRWIYPLSLQFTENYEKEGVLLIGDAAHVIHPLAGQGVNMGLRDGAVLAEVLSDSLHLGLSVVDGTMHQKYERLRRFDNFSMMLATDGLERLFASDYKIIKKVRDMGLKMIDRSRGIKQLLSESAMGTLGILPRLLREEELF